MRISDWSSDVCSSDLTRGQGRLCAGLALRPCAGAELQKKSVLPAEQLRPKIARRRAQWRKYQGRLDPRHLVFIDETWAKTNMAPLRGWAPKGQRRAWDRKSTRLNSRH